uniref:Uncharacterized protein n=1 Tax=Magnetococcus massalia (strain MO-1) TaxID=451514 RepID=A0A1S7LPX9_MAGMO|nr:conserved protein of unknown function [Candidatus Magnetococcus massalia]
MVPIQLLSKAVLTGMALRQGAVSQQQLQTAAAMDEHAKNQYEMARTDLQECAKAVLLEIEGLGLLRLDVMERRLGYVEEVCRRIPCIYQSEQQKLLDRLTRMKRLCERASSILHAEPLQKSRAALIGVGSFGGEGVCDADSGNCCLTTLVKRIHSNIAMRWIIQGINIQDEKKGRRWFSFSRQRKLEKALVQTFLDESKQAAHAVKTAEDNCSRSEEAVEKMRATVRSLTLVGHAAAECRDLIRLMDVRFDIAIDDLEEAAKSGVCTPEARQATMKALHMAEVMLHLVEAPLLNTKWQVADRHHEVMEEGVEFLRQVEDTGLDEVFLLGQSAYQPAHLRLPHYPEVKAVSES